MKFKLLLGAFMLSSVLFLTSCEKLGGDLTLDLKQTQEGIELTFPIIDTTMVGQEVSLVDMNIYVNVDSVLTANNIDKSKIESIFLKSFTASIEPDQATKDFSFVEKLMFKFKESSETNLKSVGELNATDLAGKSTITVTFPNPDTQKDLAIDLAKYFGKTNFIYSVSGKAKQTTSAKTKCKGSLSYTVKYKAADK